MRIRLADTAADRFLTYLEAFTSPRRTPRSGEPVTIEGSGQAMPKNSWRIRGGVIRVKIGAPIDAEQALIRYKDAVQALGAPVQRGDSLLTLAPAERYRLDVLASDVEDTPDAVTRFVRVGRPDQPPLPTGHDKTTLVAFISDDHAGALLEVLTEFAVRGVNLTRIESRPTGAALGDYCFSIDAEGGRVDRLKDVVGPAPATANSANSRAEMVRAARCGTAKLLSN